MLHNPHENRLQITEVCEKDELYKFYQLFFQRNVNPVRKNYNFIYVRSVLSIYLVIKIKFREINKD